jgi:hypothetical protein
MASMTNGRVRRLIFSAILAAGIGAGATGVVLAATSGASRAASTSTATTSSSPSSSPPRRRRIIARAQMEIRGSGANLMIILARRSAPGPPGRSAARVTALLRRMPGIFLLIGRPSARQRGEPFQCGAASE